MTSHLPLVVHLLVVVVLALGGLGLLAMFLVPTVKDSREAGINAHGWDEPTLSDREPPRALEVGREPALVLDGGDEHPVR